jgi:hypothetical protein
MQRLADKEGDMDVLAGSDLRDYRDRCLETHEIQQYLKGGLDLKRATHLNYCETCSATVFVLMGSD